ncbi:MAG: RNA polymerase sigma factor [Planctomycetota bacterium]
MTANHPTDLDLAQRVASGDEAAATEVFESLAGEMFGFARKMLGDEVTAEDALQEAMVAVLRGAARFDGRVSLRAWAFSILRNKVTDVYRKRGREILVHSEDPERDSFLKDGHWQDTSFGVWNEGAELLEVVQRCMEGLPIHQREAIELRAMEGLSSQDAADAMGVSADNLRQILHRGRASVRKCADAKMEGAA